MTHPLRRATDISQAEHDRRQRRLRRLEALIAGHKREYVIEAKAVERLFAARGRLTKRPVVGGQTNA